ncbi:MAG: tRNA pseudouridine(55) synthase TruB [Clostridiaceae bacterium]|nr:tRNA pseudouridine(55) synthase TruB [Clostridiaceae bacterium]
MNGIINVLKPPGMTSHDVVSFIRKVLNMKKVGHTGTLDPEAAGVLPICVGKATKVVQYITDKKKRYRANIKFGIVTDTYDKYGKIIRETGPITVDPKVLEETLKSFTGIISQKPPIYSALKVKGKKLYQYAREGKEVQISERPVEIYELKLVDIVSEDEAMIDILCSKGTYIRSLCYDIGEALGCGAHMSQLVRLESSPFTIENSNTLEEIKAAVEENRLSDILKSVEMLFKHYKAITVKTSALSSIINGNPLFEQGVMQGFEGLNENEDLCIYGEDGFIGIGSVRYEADKQRLYIKVKNIFI